MKILFRFFIALGLLAIFGTASPVLAQSTIDFETPSLGTTARQISDPYVDPSTGVQFSAEPSGFGDEVTGLVKNSATSACVDPSDDNQKLGTGRDDGSTGGSVGLSGFAIKATFPAVLAPPVTVSSEFQVLAGQPIRIRLFSSAGVEVGAATGTANPGGGTCGYPGDPRARTTIAATSSQHVAYAILDLATSTGGYVFVIDDFKFSAGSGNSFPGGPSDDITPSLGSFRILVHPAFRPLMAGYPGYDGISRLQSPNLYDPHTVIGRSDVHTDGDASDSAGVPVGTAGTVIADSDFSVLPPGFEGPVGTREVHTEVRELNMTSWRCAGIPGVAVRAGIHAPTSPLSPGEVESQGTGTDFPADSFFNIHAEIDLPPMAGFPGGTLYNPAPLLVANQNLNAFPPHVVYRHVNSNAVPLHFRDTNPGFWNAGDLFGWIVLAGHAVGFECEDEAELKEILEREPELVPVPIEIDHFESTQAQLTLQLPTGAEETVQLQGPATVHVFIDETNGGAEDSDNDGLDQVQTEMVTLDLRGHSSLGQLTVRLNSEKPSKGEIEEQQNNTPGVLDLPPFADRGTADSFFDIYFEVELEFQGGESQIFHVAQPVRMQTPIAHKPPKPGTSYQNPFTEPIELLDANGNPTGIFVVAEVHTLNPRPALDHFKCYDIVQGEPANAGVVLRDQFLSEDARVLDPFVFCNPTEKRHNNRVTPIQDKDAHLEFYHIETSNQEPPRAISASNQFGKDQKLKVFEPLFLAVPTQKLVPGQHQPPRYLDHFKCYRAEGDPIDVGVSLTDQFNLEPDAKVLDPFIFCNPTAKLHNNHVTRIQSPKEHMMCYNIEGPASEGVSVVYRNQFGEGGLFVRQPRLLCVPSSKDKVIEVDEWATTRALVGIQLPDGSLVNVIMGGPTTVEVDLHSLADDDANGLQEVDTELVSMQLSSGSGMILRGGSAFGLPASIGQIEEKVNIQPTRLDLPGPHAPFCTPPVAADCVGTQANSYFDVMFELEVPALGKFYNKVPLRVEAMIDEKPPSTRYVHVITDPIELFDANDNPTGLFLVSAEHDTRPPLDHFKCYDIIEGEPANAGVVLRDQFLIEGARVLDPFVFCNPVEKLHNDRVTPINDEDAHLEFYRIETDTQEPPRAVLASNQFGKDQKLKVFEPMLLAVPTQKLVPGQHAFPRNLDHFKCYRAEGASIDVGVSLTDQFNLEPDARVLDPFVFCNPVEKRHNDTVTPIGNSDDHMMCYNIQGPASDGLSVTYRNQFNRGDLRVRDSRLLCVPSSKDKVVEVDEWAATRALVGIQLPDGSLVNVIMGGPTTVEVDLHSLADDNANGLEDVDTELLSMQLSSSGGMILRGGSAFGLPATLGQIEEKVNVQPGRLDLRGPHAPFCTPPVNADCVGTQANSYFDVIFELEVPALGKFYNKVPLRVEAMIDEKPPRTRYIHVITEPIELFNANGEATGLFLVSAEHDTRPSLDHFKCYDVNQGESANATVTLTDQFGTEQANVFDPRVFCNPVEKLHDNRVTPIGDEDAHLTFYGIETLNPDPPRAVLASNQFGDEQRITVSEPRFLAVPTKKNQHAAPENLDHFKCYEASGDPIGAVVDLRDQFHLEAGVNVLDPVLFCNPVEKRHNNLVTPIENPEEHLMCYNIQGPTFDGTTVQIRNQFVQGTLSVGGPRLLCVPSSKDKVIEVDQWATTRALVGIQLPDGSLVNVIMSGPTTVEVDLTSLADDDANGLEDVDTELLSMQLSSGSGMILRGGSAFGLPASIGQIEEKVNVQPNRLDLRGPHAPLCTPPVPADCVGTQANSYFDVLFELEVPTLGKFYNKVPLRVEAMIDEKPPRTRYVHVITDPIELFNANDEPTGLFLVSAEHDTRPQLSHFQCYNVVQGEPIDESVFLTDQFGAGGVEVFDPYVFCNPAEKRHDNQLTPIEDGDAHLTFYQIQESANPVTRNVEVSNQFGEKQPLKVIEPLYLAVPTQKLDPGQHAAPRNLDHFKCYRVEGEAINTPISLRDQFWSAHQDVRVLRPQLLCNPAAKRHNNTETPIENPEDHLTCYQLEGPDFTRDVRVRNQFGEAGFVVEKSELMCVPSEKKLLDLELEIDHYEMTRALVGIQFVDGREINVILGGPATVEVDLTSLQDVNTIGAPGANGLEELDTELVHMELTGSSSVGMLTLRAGRDQGITPSHGQIEEKENIQSGRLDLRGPDAPLCTPPIPADCVGTQANSFFNVMFELEIPGVGKLHNQEPLRIEAMIDEKPPKKRYKHVITEPIELYDADGNPTGIRLVSAEHNTSPMEIDELEATRALVGIRMPDGTLVNTILGGPATIEVDLGNLKDANTIGEPGPNGLEEVDTELISMQLTGNGMTLRAGRVFGLPATLGQIEEKVDVQTGRLDLPGPDAPLCTPPVPADCVGTQANSFFDVMFELEVPSVGKLHNNVPLRLESMITEKPPKANYKHVITEPIELFDENNNATGIFLVTAEHATVPIEVDEFSHTIAAIRLNTPNGPATVRLRGPTTAHVFIDEESGAASDSDDDGLDQVESKMVELNLRGYSPIGRVEVSLNEQQPTLGGIEEQVNNTPGVLDVEPFADSGMADSFFDVYVELRVGDQVLHNDEPIHMESPITHKPPAHLDIFQTSPNAEPVGLNTPDNEPTGIEIVRVIHWPNPPRRINPLPRIRAQFVLQNASNRVPVLLTGPMIADVFIDSFCAARDVDGNGLDEVPTELTQLTLQGESPLGSLTMRLSPAIASMGELEERVNIQSNRLDVPPCVESGLADSFFDVWVELEIQDAVASASAGRSKQSTQVLHSTVPIRLQAVVDEQDPLGDNAYTTVIDEPIQLVDENDNPTDLSFVDGVEVDTDRSLYLPIIAK